MPRWIASTPLPSGRGSPGATTLRMSATRSGSGRSRPQLTPVRWKSFLVGAADEIAHRGHRAVGHHLDRLRGADRAQVARLSQPKCLDLGHGREAEAVQAHSARQLAGLDLVELVVAAHQQQPDRGLQHVVAGIVGVGGEHQRLHRALQRDASSAATSSQVDLPGVGVFSWGAAPRGRGPAPPPRPARCWRRSRWRGNRRSRPRRCRR